MALRRWNPATRRRNADGHGFRWKGGRIIDVHGYARILNPKHVHADSKGYVLEHIALASDAIGRKLPDKAEIHHFNEKKADNSPGNLVLCEDRAYHALLHLRARALRECGHANWRRCSICKTWSAPEGMRRVTKVMVHRECLRARARTYWRTKQERAGKVPRQFSTGASQRRPSGKMQRVLVARGQP